MTPVCAGSVKVSCRWPTWYRQAVPGAGRAGAAAAGPGLAPALAALALAALRSGLAEERAAAALAAGGAALCRGGLPQRSGEHEHREQDGSSRPGRPAPSSPIHRDHRRILAAGRLAAQEQRSGPAMRPSISLAKLMIYLPIGN